MDKENSKGLYYINYDLNEELKQIINNQISFAQNVTHPHYLPNLQSYSVYHVPLENYLKKYNKISSKPDKLAFLLLLTYSSEQIRNFNSIKELKLSFNDEESDFTIIDEKKLDYKDTDVVNVNTNFVNTCICSKSIRNIFIVQNKHTNITFQVGCECITKHGLVSFEELKEHKKKLQELKKTQYERKKEQEEGKEEGYYENERNNNIILKEQKKQINMELKLMKQEDKRMKSIEKEIQAELKELNKSGFYFYINKNCYFCKRVGIYKSTDKICICSTCSPSNNKLLKKNINSEIKKALEDCLNCDLPFINTSKESCELCRICKKKVKINHCKMCKSQFVLGINKNDLYCDVCDENLINCLDCKRELLKQQSQNLRCYKCNHRRINNLILINCQYCDVEIEVSEKDKWRTCCRNCYLNKISLQKCNSCDDMFKKLPHESWKKTCTTCYYKNKT